MRSCSSWTPPRAKMACSRPGSSPNRPESRELYSPNWMEPRKAVSLWPSRGKWAFRCGMWESEKKLATFYPSTRGPLWILCSSDPGQLHLPRRHGDIEKVLIVIPTGALLREAKHSEVEGPALGFRNESECRSTALTIMTISSSAAPLNWHAPASL